MKDQLQARLKALKEEFAAGQKMLADLHAREASLQESLLRISGAIQVLEEELGKMGTNNGAETPAKEESRTGSE